MKAVLLIFCCMLGGIMTLRESEIHFNCHGIADGESCWREDGGDWWISDCRNGVCVGFSSPGNGNACTSAAYCRSFSGLCRRCIDGRCNYHTCKKRRFSDNKKIKESLP
ncbi:uncharacterized protein LOC127709114 [Mytilus californianus]|uniref:uncharacterized protein LOC127709114 n=1 Tax=Mytilus californianus TaxID=6549 RepID=UPI0022455EC6|nr:uncharacterized protein LOC127709114 [Mytilus californianus]